MRILCVTGTRPNIVKASGVIKEARRRNIDIVWVHTGQHYSHELKDGIISALDIGDPSYSFVVPHNDAQRQHGSTVELVSSVCVNELLDCAVVFGDVNATLAASFACVNSSVPLAHVESGLRCGDMKMREEVNRFVTDAMSDVLFTTEKRAHYNLTAEGVDAHKIYFVGNILSDVLYSVIDKIDDNYNKLAAAHALHDNEYALVTLHRAELVDNKDALFNVLKTLSTIVDDNRKIVFPIHPRTRARLHQFGLDFILHHHNIVSLPPVPYDDFIALIKHARYIITDSGGAQCEAAILKRPCITLRERTEHTVTVDSGCNIVTGFDKCAIDSGIAAIERANGSFPDIPLWDGRVSGRILDTLEAMYG